MRDKSENMFKEQLQQQQLQQQRSQQQQYQHQQQLPVLPRQQQLVQPWQVHFSLCFPIRVVDPGGVNPGQNPTLKKKTDPDPTVK